MAKSITSFFLCLYHFNLKDAWLSASKHVLLCTTQLSSLLRGPFVACSCGSTLEASAVFLITFKVWGNGGLMREESKGKGGVELEIFTWVTARHLGSKVCDVQKKTRRLLHTQIQHHTNIASAFFSAVE